MHRCLGIFLLISLFFCGDLVGQSRHRSFTVKEVVGNLRRSDRIDLDQGSKLVILQKRTDKRDRFGTLARLRLLEEDEYPENDETGVEILEDRIMSSSRTKELYPLTDASHNVYFIYALTPDGKLLQSVAWSTTRSIFEPAFERYVGQQIDLSPLRDATRIDRVRIKYFSGEGATIAQPTASASSLVDGPTNNESDTSSVQKGPDFSADADSKLTIKLSELTGDSAMPLRSLPSGTSVALFTSDADLGSQGYTFVPLPNQDTPFPESTQSRPVFASLNSATGGPELSRKLAITDVLNPDAYFVYALTPGGKMYQSAARISGYLLPAYEVVRNGTFIMMPVLDADRSKRIKGIYWAEEKDYTWLWWLIPVLLVLLGLTWGLSRQSKKQEVYAEKEWKKVAEKKDDSEHLAMASSPRKTSILDGRYGIYEQADDAYFLNEVDPLLRDDQKLRDSIILYREQIKENIETIFLEDFEKGHRDQE